jgi:hypothetical protein
VADEVIFSKSLNNPSKFLNLPNADTHFAFFYPCFFRMAMRGVLMDSAAKMKEWVLGLGFKRKTPLKLSSG